MLMALPRAAESMPGRGTVSPALVGNFAWVDSDLDGIQDPGERGAAGIQVVLYDGSGSSVDTTTTDANGFYLFECLLPDEYSIGFQPSSEFALTQQNQGVDDAVDSDAHPSTGRTATFSLGPGQTDLTWDAGVYRPPGPDTLAQPSSRVARPAVPASGAPALVDCPPTAAALAAVSKAWTPAGMRLTWRTSSEVGILGFNIRRANAKLNAKLVSARAPGASGARYRFLDRTARPNRSYAYRLETVYVDGHSTFTAFR